MKEKIRIERRGEILLDKHGRYLANTRNIRSIDSFWAVSLDLSHFDKTWQNNLSLSISKNNLVLRAEENGHE